MSEEELQKRGEAAMTIGVILGALTVAAIHLLLGSVILAAAIVAVSAFVVFAIRAGAFGWLDYGGPDI